MLHLVDPGYVVPSDVGPFGLGRGEERAIAQGRRVPCDGKTPLPCTGCSCAGLISKSGQLVGKVEYEAKSLLASHSAVERAAAGGARQSFEPDHVQLIRALESPPTPRSRPSAWAANPAPDPTAQGSPRAWPRRVAAA